MVGGVVSIIGTTEYLPELMGTLAGPKLIEPWVFRALLASALTYTGLVCCALALQRSATAPAATSSYNLTVVHPSFSCAPTVNDKVFQQLGRRWRGSNVDKSSSKVGFSQQLGVTSRPLFVNTACSPTTSHPGHNRSEANTLLYHFLVITHFSLVSPTILQYHHPATQAKLLYYRKDLLPRTCMLPHDSGFSPVQ